MWKTIKARFHERIFPTWKVVFEGVMIQTTTSILLDREPIRNHSGLIIEENDLGKRRAFNLTSDDKRENVSLEFLNIYRKFKGEKGAHLYIELKNVDGGEACLT